MAKDKEYKEQRKLKLEEWEGKGVEWCANQLWNARRELEKTRRAKTWEREQRWREQAKYNIDYWAVKRANENMADVLEKNGIRPTKLRITYYEADCENCPSNGSENGEWDCYGCGEEFDGYAIYERQKIYTADIAFYTYMISGSKLEGITAQFENMEYHLIKVVDERTGEIIGEWDYPEDTAETEETK